MYGTKSYSTRSNACWTFCWQQFNNYITYLVHIRLVWLALVHIWLVWLALVDLRQVSLALVDLRQVLKQQKQDESNLEYSWRYCLLVTV
jgi:hypothetical protein